MGHTAAVTAIDTWEDLVITGGLDGAVWIRDHQGRSRIPPAGLPAVLCLAVLPGTDLVLVGTAGMVHGLDLESGRCGSIDGFAGMHAVAAVGIADQVVLAGSDGSLRTIDAENPPRTIARFPAAVRSIAALGDTVVAACADGTVRVIDLTGTLQRETTCHPLEVTCAAAGASATGGSTVILGGMEHRGASTAGGGLLVLNEALEELATVPLKEAVVAAGYHGEGILAATAGGQIVRIENDWKTTTVVHRRGRQITAMHVSDTGVWTAEVTGAVSRMEPPVEFPWAPSGAVAATMTIDERYGATADHEKVVLWDLRTGDAVVTLAREGVKALSFAEDNTLDIVLAYHDGRLERRAAPQWTTVVGATQLDAAPAEVGYVGPYIIVQDLRSTPPAVQMFDAETFQPVEPTEDALEDRCVMERRGITFTGGGLLADTHLSLVGGTHLVVQRPGLLTATTGATTVVRIWDGTGFLR